MEESYVLTVDKTEREDVASLYSLLLDLFTDPHGGCYITYDAAKEFIDRINEDGYAKVNSEFFETINRSKFLSNTTFYVFTETDFFRGIYQDYNFIISLESFSDGRSKVTLIRDLRRSFDSRFTLREAKAKIEEMIEEGQFEIDGTRITDDILQNLQNAGFYVVAKEKPSKFYMDSKFAEEKINEAISTLSGHDCSEVTKELESVIMKLQSMNSEENEIEDSDDLFKI